MIDDLRRLERLLYKNPIICKNDFPSLPDEELAAQEYESCSFNYGICQSLCYIYVRENEESWFVDIYWYLYSYFDNEIVKRRFIIAPGYQMDENDESEFSFLVYGNDVLFISRVCDGYIEKISKYIPDMPDYKDLGLALHHTYFSSFHGGIRELLVKAGLIHISFNLFEVDEFNVMADNIEAAFGIPMEMLRKLNSQRGSEKVLATKESRKRAATVYERYADILESYDEVNEFQIFYLSECMEENESVDMKMLEELEELESGWDQYADEEVDGYEIYEQLRVYQEKSREINALKGEDLFPLYPRLRIEDLEQFYALRRKLISCVEDEMGK